MSEQIYSSSDFPLVRQTMEGKGFIFVGPLGVFDDAAPDGSPDTACQANVERQVALGNLIQVVTKIGPNVSRLQLYLLIPPTVK